MNKPLSLAVGATLLSASVTAQAAYVVDAYVNGTYTPKFQLCNLVEIYSQSQVLFSCSQTPPPTNLGYGSIEFNIYANYGGQNYLCIGTLGANGTQSTYYPMTACTPY